MKLISGTSNLVLAESISFYLEIPLTSVDIQKFPDGEISIRIQEDVVDEDVYVLQSLAPNANEGLIELLLLIHVLREKRVKSITTIIAYYAYARQKESVSFVADILGASGVNRILTIDPHTLDVGTDTLMTTSLFVADIQSRFKSESMIIVSPDAGGIERARCVAQKLTVDLVVLDKVRELNLCVHKIDADVKGKNCLIIDDIVDSGATLVGAAKALSEAGAREIHAYVTHALLSGNAVDQIKQSKIDSLTTTYSIRSDKLAGFRSLSVAETLGQAIKFF